MFNKTRQKELTETGKSELYTDLTKLIIKIADYIFRKEEDIRKGIGDIMGGKVLELESERLKAEGRTEGEAIGQARGEAIGQIQGETRLGSLITRLLQDQRTKKSRLYQQTPKDVSSYIKNTIFKKNGRRKGRYLSSCCRHIYFIFDFY